MIITNVLDKRKQEILETMLKARDAKYSIVVRYGKVLFCGASAAGKSNFLNLLMEEDFQSMHKSTEVLKPHQVTIAMKALTHISSNKKEVEFERMNIEKEILQLESYLPDKHTESIPAKEKRENNLKGNSERKIPDTKPVGKALKTEPDSETFDPTEDVDMAIANGISKKLPKKKPKDVWDILTFMDTGGQPQLISMLPAVNSFAMITFIVHKLQEGGKESLERIVEVQYGNEKGEISFDWRPHKYTYLQLIETLISYASNILLPDTKFLDSLKNRSKKNDHNEKFTRLIVLIGTHSGDDKLQVEDIDKINGKLKIAVERSGVDHIKPYLNKNYKYLVPVDNEKQNRKSDTQVPEVLDTTKRYTKISEIRKLIQKFLEEQDEIHVPIKWVLLELEIRKVCLEKGCNMISYKKVLELAEKKKFGYAGEFGHDEINSEEFIKDGLRFHHSFGVLLYFEDVEGMRELIITNHQWLFNKLTDIVCYSFKKDIDGRARLKDLEKKGILHKTLLCSNFLNIQKDFEESEIDIVSINPVESFLSLLKYLGIAAPLSEKDNEYFMPFVLESCELTELKESIPEYKDNNAEPPLLVQFTSNEDKTFSFPRGAFCFLVVDLMLNEKWEIYKQAYINLLTFIKVNNAIHYITLVDRIFCLEIHVTCKECCTVHNEIREIINKALKRVATKLKIQSKLCHGFPCSSCKVSEMHISYVSEDNDNRCCCDDESMTELMDYHKVWLETYFTKVHSIYVRMYALTSTCTIHTAS